MSTSTSRRKLSWDWPIVLSILLCVLLSAFAWQAYLRKQSAISLVRAAQDANRREQDSLAEHRRAEAINLKKVKGLVEAKNSRSDLGSADEGVAASVAGELFITDHPESRELVRASMNELAASWPARRAREAGFSAEQIKQWTALFERQKGAPFAVVSGISPNFGDLSPGEVQGPMLKAIVGEALYQHYQDLEKTSYGRLMAAKLAVAAETLGAPMSTEQARSLAAIFGKGNLNESSEWSRSAKEATGLLSPVQQEIFNEEAAAYRLKEEESNYREKFLLGK